MYCAAAFSVKICLHRWKFFLFLASDISKCSDQFGIKFRTKVEPHQCLLTVRGREWLGCHAGCQEVGRCRTRGDLREHVTHTPLCQVWIRLSTLALKPRGDVTRSPKQGTGGLTKMTYVLQKFRKRNLEEAKIYFGLSGKFSMLWYTWE